MLTNVSLWPDNELMFKDDPISKEIMLFYRICLNLNKYYSSAQTVGGKQTLYDWYEQVRDFLSADAPSDASLNTLLNQQLLSLLSVPIEKLLQHRSVLEQILKDARNNVKCTKQDLLDVLEVPLFYDDYAHYLMRVKNEQEDGWVFLFNRDTHFEFILMHGTFAFEGEGIVNFQHKKLRETEVCTTCMSTHPLTHPF